MTYRDYTPDEVGRRGETLYEGKIRPLVESGNRDRYLIIDVETEEFAIGDDPDALADILHAKRPDAALYSVRIGHEAMGYIGSASLSRS